VFPEATEIVAKASDVDVGEYTKAAVITLALGGGLIPALIGGNKGMIDQLTGKRRSMEYEVDDNPETSLDPTVGDKQYRKFVSSDDVPGPSVTGSAFMFQNGDVKLSDIIAVIGRIPDLESVADWRNLPSTKRMGTVGTTPPMWLPRAAFKVNMRKAPFKGWPVDQNGVPIGGEDFKREQEKRISQKGYMISDAALDAVWDTWSGGSGISTPDKVAGALRSYRKSSTEFDVNSFAVSVVLGKSVVVLAAITFIFIQVIALGTLFIAPTLRIFFDIDIGFGDVGTCDPETCVRLFN